MKQQKQQLLIVDLRYENEEDMVYEADQEGRECFEEELDRIFSGSSEDLTFEPLEFERKDVNENVFIIGDGGDLIMLKNGILVNVCFRGCECSTWKEDSTSTVRYIKGVLFRGKRRIVEGKLMTLFGENAMYIDEVGHPFKQVVYVNDIKDKVAEIIGQFGYKNNPNNVKVWISKSFRRFREYNEMSRAELHLVWEGISCN